MDVDDREFTEQIMFVIIILSKNVGSSRWNQNLLPTIDLPGL